MNTAEAITRRPQPTQRIGLPDPPLATDRGPTPVRDVASKTLFLMEDDALRDDSGRIIALREHKDETRKVTLASTAAAWMSGRKVLMDLAQGDVAQTAVQAEFGIPDADFAADSASQVRFVTHDRGTYFLENVEDALKLTVGTASSDGPPAEINPGYTKTAFTTVGYSLCAKIPRLLDSNADFDLKKRALRAIVDALLRYREYRVAQLLITAANWPAANQVAAVAKWNGGLTANPLTDMFSALKASYIPANTIIMPETAAQFFFQNANSQAMRDYVQSGGEMPKVVFARAKFSSGSSGTTPAYIWAPVLPANVAVIRTADSIPTSITFRWLGSKKSMQDGDVVSGILARTYWDPQSDSNWIVCSHNDAEVMVSNKVGALITGALA